MIVCGPVASVLRVPACTLGVVPLGFVGILLTSLLGDIGPLRPLGHPSWGYVRLQDGRAQAPSRALRSLKPPFKDSRIRGAVQRLPAWSKVPHNRVSMASASGIVIIVWGRYFAFVVGVGG